MAYGIGSWGVYYSHYQAHLFGPDQPLGALIEKLHLPVRPDGRLDQARILVIKDQRRLELWAGDQMVKAYRIQLSQRSRGTKQKRRDQKTPEGEYAVCGHAGGRYYRALWLNYPNIDDADRALKEKRIDGNLHERILEALSQGKCPPQNTRLGGDILIHGQQPSLTRQLRRAQRKGQIKLKSGLQAGDADPSRYSTYFDWTAGCVALFNPDIRELHRYIADGTPVRIVANGPVTLPSKGVSSEADMAKGAAEKEWAAPVVSTESVVIAESTPDAKPVSAVKPAKVKKKRNTRTPARRKETR